MLPVQVCSRNRRAGILIGQGKSVHDTINTIGMAVEGVKTCQAAHELAKKVGVEMPITEQLYYVLFEGKNPKEAVEDLMLRNKTFESEEGLNKWLYFDDNCHKPFPRQYIL